MNILIIFEQVALYLPLILGAYISISVMQIPFLAIESSFVFGAIMAAKIAQLFTQASMASLIVTLIIAATSGACVGIISGALTQTRAKLSHLLANIIAIGLFHGISLFVLDSSHLSIPVNFNNLRLVNLINNYPELIIISMISMLAAIICLLFFKTQLGLGTAIYGNNPHFLKHYKISRSYIIIISLALSGALAGISGYTIAQSSGFIDIYSGINMALLCISALVLGNIFKFSKYPISILIPILGIITYFIIQYILLTLGFNLKYFTTIQALIIFIYLTIFSKHNTSKSLGI